MVAEEYLDVQECIKDLQQRNQEKVGHFLLKDFQNRAIFGMVTVNIYCYWQILLELQAARSCFPPLFAVAKTIHLHKRTGLYCILPHAEVAVFVY